MSEIQVGAAPASVLATLQIQRKDGRVELHQVRFDPIPTLTQVIPTPKEKRDGGNAQ